MLRAPFASSIPYQLRSWLQAFAEKYYHVQKLEWLRFEQAIACIDSLKNVLEKEKEKGEHHADRSDAAEKLR